MHSSLKKQCTAARTQSASASSNREQTGRYGIRSGHATVRGSPGQACLPEAATTHSRVVAVKLPLQAGQRARRRARRHPAQAAC